MIRTLLFWFLILTCLLGCEQDRHALRLELDFVPPELEGRATSARVLVRRNGCEGEVVLNAGTEDDQSDVPILASGRWAIEVQARDDRCLIVARGCDEVSLPSASDRLVVTLEPTSPPVSSCSAGQACEEGACVEPRSFEPVLASGRAHTCFSDRPDQLQCWGYNETGQLGTGDFNTSLVPVPVMPWTELVSVLSAGGGGAWLSHTCAIVSGGRISCWGYNMFGQVGDGTTVNRSSPVASADGVAAHDIATGARHTCALTPDGAAFCWGDNADGQIGLDPAEVPFSTIPKSVPGLPSFLSEIEAGDAHTCALNGNGNPFCWGDNEDGQLGVEGVVSSYEPVRALPDAGLEPLTELAGGVGHTCGLGVSGAVYCWGQGGRGQLGGGTDSSSVEPVTAVGIADAISVGAGSGHTCVLHRTGRVSCWGGNAQGQLGTGDSTGRNTPAEVVGLEDVSQLSVGQDHACALTSTGQLYCWGQNQHGRLGDGTTVVREMPVLVVGFE